MFRSRQKTTTGCMVCRRRRKKCDETHPHCGACTRNGLRCHWPVVLNAAAANSRAKPQTAPRRSGDLPTAPHSELEESTSRVLDYCINVFLPAQVHSHAPAENAAIPYMVGMATQYPPLLDALLATTALVMPMDHPDSRALPTMYYHSGIVGLSHDIKNGILSGTEDCLLATLIWLCAFEVCTTQETPSID